MVNRHVFCVHKVTCFLPNSNKIVKNAAKHGLKDAKSFVYCLLLINFATPLVAT
jgi:hypothetical protein